MNTSKVNNKEATYQSLEELVEDLHFLEYVRNQADNETLWKHRIPEGRSSWIAEAEEIVKALHFNDENPSHSVKQEIWQAIAARNIEKPTSAKVFRMGWTRWAAAAAILLATWTTWTLWSSSDAVTVTTEMAETTSHTLPDESTVSLNADSRISYNEESWVTERSVSLEGEAFFEVKKGESFVVNTAGGSVQVLGTSFNVVSRGDIFEVACYTGKVKVERDGLSAILTPGAKVTLQNGLLQKIPFQPNREKSWMEGYFLFNSQPLSHVLEEIERQFDVKIHAEAVSSGLLYNGFFTKDDLTQALQAVCWPLRLKFDIAGHEVTIYKEE